MQPPHFHPRTALLVVGGTATAVGLIGGISGLLAGLLAPEVTIGVYALSGPEPPHTFSPALWGTQRGFLIGSGVGAGGGLFAYVLPYALSWRPRMTTRRLMVAVAVAGIGMGVVVALIRSPNAGPMRLLTALIFLVAWGVAANVCGFSGLWLLKRIRKLIHSRSR